MSEFQKKLNRRQKRFKNKSTRNRSRDKRIRITVKYSKNKRSEMLMKRRNILSNNNNNSNDNFVKNEELKIPSIEDLPLLVKGIKSNDLKTIENCTKSIRMMLSVAGDPPIMEILETNLLQTFIQFLQQTENEILQFESAWILSNICSGTTNQTEQVVQLGVIPLFFEGLESQNLSLRIQCVWGLGNIAGDCIKFRNFILEIPNSIENIINIISKNQNNVDILQNSAWTLSNLCRGEPHPPHKLIKNIIPIFSKLIHHDSEQLVIDTCWGLNYLSLGSPENIDEIFKSGCLDKLIQLLNHQSFQIRTPVIRTIGNLVNGDHRQTQIVLDHELLDNLKKNLNDPQIQIVKEACWVLSNITAGTNKQVDLVIQKNIFPIIFKLLKSDVYVIKKESCWVICNAIYAGSDEHIEYLVKSNVIQLLSPFLDSRESKLVRICLESYLRILNVGEKISRNMDFSTNNYAIEMENEGIKKKIKLYYNEYKNKKINRLSEQILISFFSDSESEPEEEEEDPLELQQNKYYINPNFYFDEFPEIEDSDNYLDSNFL
ncbi:importin subunit alpha [Anaeramoeba flamelloides]|uniref:Importin subunit alpha n=1 Tax=Anaeramoeba flamelloides TaxID=1746091 RepID=A0AAV7YRB8_9EUKA|nr:importin subunit alpha [Anaeramoeba flamelloides]